MFRRHASKYLSAFAQGELPSDQASNVATHLRDCDRCTKELNEIEQGISLAKHIPTISTPPALSSAVETLFKSRALISAESRRRFTSGRRRWVVALAAVGLIAAVGSTVWYKKLRNPISIEPIARRTTKLEAIALDLHKQQRYGRPQVDFATDDPATLGQWVRQTAGLELELAHQPPGDFQKYKSQGGKILTTPSGPIAVVFLRIDLVPVTLVTARVNALQKREAPSEGILRKRILYRLDSSSGINLLSWTRGEQTYVFASELPHLGRAACFVCHTDPRRRELIRNARQD